AERVVAVDDDAAIAIENLAAGCSDGLRLNMVTLGQLVVHLRILDLQGPETGDEKEEDGDAGVLEDGDLAGCELGVVAQDRRVGYLLLLFEIRIDGGQACLCFQCSGKML